MPGGMWRDLRFKSDRVIGTRLYIFSCRARPSRCELDFHSETSRIPTLYGKPFFNKKNNRP